MTDVEGAFRAAFQAPPEFIVRAPGRVNLLGEHVDYNDGWVLPAAIDRAAYLAARAAPEPVVSLAAPDLEASAAFRLSELDAEDDPAAGANPRLDAIGRPLARWAWYPAGVAWALRRHGLRVVGLEAALTSTVPRGAGLSSSAAVEVAFAAAWQRLGGWELPPLELARLCQRAENRYVGVASGLMDQFASICGRAGHALLLDCRTLDWQPVPLPAGVSIVVADSGVRREIARSEYNTRRAQCQVALAGLRQAMGNPGLRALRDVSVEDFNRYAPALDPLVARRARHVVEECARTRAAAGLLRAGRVADFGALMNECHASLRDMYEVSCLELDALAEAAQRIEGCFGARLTGAGFGGCTVNLVAAATAEDFRRDLSRAYQEATGRQAAIWVCQAADGAAVLQPGG
ncbi:MAG: galactokinase [Anaerolineales bacterium]|nr:galactokinase [Anaerolineales bacterium]